MENKADSWYTFQFTLFPKEVGAECEVHEFKDCNIEGLEKIRNALLTRGLKIDINKGLSWEIIMPWNIKQALIIKQDQKFAL